MFGTNHLGHALLIQKLLPLLEATAAAEDQGNNNDGYAVRIVILSSTGWRGTPPGGIVFSALRTKQEMIMGTWRAATPGC